MFAESTSTAPCTFSLLGCELAPREAKSPIDDGMLTRRIHDDDQLGRCLNDVESVWRFVTLYRANYTIDDAMSASSRWTLTTMKLKSGTNECSSVDSTSLL